MVHITTHVGEDNYEYRYVHSNTWGSRLGWLRDVNMCLDLLSGAYDYSHNHNDRGGAGDLLLHAVV